MRPIVTGGVAWSLGHDPELRKNYWTDRNSKCRFDSLLPWVGGSKEACIRWGTPWRNLANTIEPSICGSDSRITLTTCWTFGMFISLLC